MAEENKVVIGPARPEEYDRLIEIDKRACVLFRPTGLLSPEALDDHVSIEDLARANRAGWLLCARLNHHPVGFVMAGRRDSDLYVEQISVDPAFGRQGVGRQLMARIEVVASSRNLSALTLSTFRDLAWNAPFYASIGYRELERSAFASYMFEIEQAQMPFMDVTKRTFMRKQLRKPPQDDKRRS